MKTTIFNKTLAIATMVAVMVGMCSCEKKYVDGQLQGNLKVSNIYFEPTELPIGIGMVVNVTKHSNKLYIDVKEDLLPIVLYKMDVHCTMSNDTLDINYKYSYNHLANGVRSYAWGFCVQPVTLNKLIIKGNLIPTTRYVELREDEAVELYCRKDPDDLTGL